MVTAARHLARPVLVDHGLGNRGGRGGPGAGRVARPGRGQSPAIYVDPDWSTDQIVRQAFKTILAYEEHECREKFRYQGKPIFGPHISVQSLLDAVDTDEAEKHPNGKSGAW